MLIIRGVNLFPSQIEELILKVGLFSPHYLLEVRRIHHLDQLDVVVEPRDSTVADLTAAQAAELLAHDIKSFIGITARIRVEAPGSVTRSAGKARRVNDFRS
jgi:phenylacetate-CoA ligase